jgi:hypothetical protein
MYDPRLIGTWRSDAQKTIRELATRADMRLAKNKKLATLFGKLELRFTPSHYYFRYEDVKSVCPYKVAAKDEYSVAIVSTSPIAGRQITHINFEGSSYYWVPLGSSGLREFFKRVKSKPRKTKKLKAAPSAN